MADASAPKIFEPKELKVLDSIPENERNTVIDQYFTPRIDRRLKVPASAADWKADASLMKTRLRSKSFRGWPSPTLAGDLETMKIFKKTSDGLVFTRYAFSSQAPFRLPLFVVHRQGIDPEDLDLIVLNVLDENTWNDFLTGMGSNFPGGFPRIEKLPPLDKERFEAEKKMHANMKWGMAYLAPRGIGPTAWTDDPKEQIHIRRRFNLLGQTLDGMRVWDTRRGIQALQQIGEMEKPKLWLQSSGDMAGNTLYASLFEKNIHRLDLHDLPNSHQDGPTYLNILRFMDVPHAAAMAAGKSQLRIYTDDQKEWEFLTKTAAKLDWDEKQLQIRKVVEGKNEE